MNVFVLCTGRTGSTTFIKACKHITNYTSAHESLSNQVGDNRFSFPDNHIEADNRLSWQLGMLHQKYGDEAYYVHLKRDRHSTTTSFMDRFLLPKNLIYAYANGIKKQPPESLSKKERYDLCLDYVDTVNANIALFLKDKPNKIIVNLENITSDFTIFWKNIHAKGDLQLALQEWNIAHNKKDSKKIYWRYSIKHLFLKAIFVLKSL